MNLKNNILATVIGLSGVCATAQAQMYDDPRMFSFENKQELSYIKTSKSAVELSDAHWRNGKTSLQWTFHPGASLSIKKDLQFEPLDKNGVDNYLSAFIVWVYNEQPQKDKQIRFNFLKDGKQCTSFPVNINFRGWRGIWVCYERDMEGTPEVGMNEIRIDAPDVKGKLYFDHLITATKVDPRQQTADMQIPFVNKKTKTHWLVVLKNYNTQPDIPLTELTQQNRQQIKVIEERFRELIYTPSKLYPKHMDELRSKFAKYNISRKNGNITGTPIWYVRHAEAYERIIKPWDKNILTRTGFEMLEYFNLMQKIAFAWNNATEAADKAELKKMFLLMYDNITDQGVCWGSCWGNVHHYGYSLRNMYSAYFLMKDVLREEGKLEEAVNTMIWYSQTNELYTKPVANGMDMDTFNTAAQGCMASILLMDDSPEKLRYLRSCSRWLDWGCRPAQGLNDSFKIDGSAYHHCNNYPAYAIGGLSGATQMIYLFSGTDFAVGELAHQTVKNALLAMRFYCNKLEFPLSMSGRHPDGKGKLMPIHYGYMALSGTPDGKQQFDREMGNAYLRLATNVKNVLDKKIKQKIVTMGSTPEEDPQGNMALGYACVSVQRRNNWSAVVRGHSRYLWDAEHYIGENLYGRYLGFGSLQILTAPAGTDVTPKTSGWQQPGFDWNRIPGTTSIHLPWAELKAQVRNVDTFSGVEEMLLSDEAFAGGLSQRGVNGNFGMKLHEHDKYDGSHRARKSFHFFDNVIVCLGTGIENTDSKHNTETTVFQMAATDAKAQNYWKNYAVGNGKSWLDHAGTGYYTPQPVKFTGLVKQESRIQNTDKQTEGQWATVYFDHGKAPKNASYEYAVLPQTTREKIDAFAAAPTYKVLRADNEAHIVSSDATHTVSYVLFETPKDVLPGGPLLKADTTCLAMVRMINSKKMLLTVTQPDLALYRGPNDDIYKDGKRVERSVYSRKWRGEASKEIPVRITLRGKWNFTGNDAIKLVEQTKKSTTIEFVCTDGLSFNVELEK